ncbi:hypothetical protein CLOP_g23590 [Closterium sp. NIES-67]|nr:hypothetical protein CLOP_g23590 [Closterium sp. NIES-67]
MFLPRAIARPPGSSAKPRTTPAQRPQRRSGPPPPDPAACSAGPGRIGGDSAQGIAGSVGGVWGDAERGGDGSSGGGHAGSREGVNEGRAREGKGESGTREGPSREEDKELRFETGIETAETKKDEKGEREEQEAEEKEDDEEEEEEEEEVKERSVQQRAAEPGEPVCAVCGRYGEYICDATNLDVCSRECKAACVRGDVPQRREEEGVREEEPVKGSEREVEEEEEAEVEEEEEEEEEEENFTLDMGAWSSISDAAAGEIRTREGITVHGDPPIPAPILDFDALSTLLPTSQSPSKKLLSAELILQGVISNLHHHHCMGVHAPTPVQMQAIPTILSRRDTLLSSPTGSGKSLAFLLPLVSLALLPLGGRGRRVGGLVGVVLAPSRELAAQHHETIKGLLSCACGGPAGTGGGGGRNGRALEGSRGVMWSDLVRSDAVRSNAVQSDVVRSVLLVGGESTEVQMGRRLIELFKLMKKGLREGHAAAAAEANAGGGESGGSAGCGAGGAAAAAAAGADGVEEGVKSRRGDAVAAGRVVVGWRSLWRALKLVVVDEVDAMVQRGFAHQLQHILSQLASATQQDMQVEEKQQHHNAASTSKSSSTRTRSSSSSSSSGGSGGHRAWQLVLASASVSKEVQEMTASLMRSPITITCSHMTVDNNGLAVSSTHVKQVVIWVEEKHKKQKLCDILCHPRHFRPPVLVFVSSRDGADLLSSTIHQLTGLQAASVHSGKPAPDRRNVIAQLIMEEIPVVVSTVGVLGRGVHIPKVSQVVVFDMPGSMEDYAHLIGRAGHVGAPGTAMAFVNALSRPLLPALVGFLKSTGNPIPRELSVLAPR